MIRDHIEPFKLSNDFLAKHVNEINCVEGLWVGLSFLADSVGKIENANKPPDITFVWGNTPLLQNVPISLVTCSFHWYSVSACNFVRLIGWLHQQLNPTAPSHGDYVERVLPEVLPWRNKVAAHFARIYERDNPAEQLASVIFQPKFEDGVFYAAPWTFRHSRGGNVCSSESLKPWSLTKVHAGLKERYEPQATNDNAADAHNSS